jgi:hypothetical protein
VNGISEMVGKTWSVPFFFIRLMLVGLAALRIDEVCPLLFRLSGKRARFSLASLFVLLFCVTDAFAAVGVTTATGGAAISADTNGANGTGVYTALTGPTLFEGATADIGTGTITLTAPAGFNFSTAANSVTVTVTCFLGAGANTLLGASPGTATQTITPTSTAITITVFQATGGTRRCALTWSGIGVRPIAGTPLASGNITSGGTSAIAGVTAGTTNFGTLTEVVGAANKLAFLQQPTDTERTVTIAPSVTVQVQDRYGNLRTASTPNITLAIATNPAGGTLAGTLTRAAIAGVATFNNLAINNAGTGYTLAATSAGLAGATSSAFNIGPTVANFLVEASAGGNIGAQTAGAPFTIKITARDASNATVTAFNRAVTLTSSGMLSGAPITTANFTSGVLASQSVTILNTGTFTITATKITGGTQFGTSNSFVVTAGPFVKLQLLVPGETAAPGTTSGKTGTPSAQTQGVPFVVTVNAVDANWNVASSVDTIHITSSDASAKLPVDAALSSGTSNYSVTLMTVGTSTITASDVTTPAILSSTSPPITLGITDPNTGTVRRFNAFEPGSPGVLGDIRTKISGATITLDLIAVNNTGTGIQNYSNTGHTVELMDSTDDTGADTLGNGCRSSWTSIQTLTTTAVFTAGRLSNFTFTYPDARRNVRIRISRGGRIGCSNDNFAIRPNALVITKVSDADPQTAGTTNNLTNLVAATATPIHKAGRPFTIKVTAQNALGTPTTTTNYAGKPNAVSRSKCTGTGNTACTGSFGTLSTGTWSADPGPGANGSVITTTATYSDIGAFGLKLTDQDFAAIDANDSGSTTLERYIDSNIFNVGRFVPNHFSVSYTTPRFGTACVSGNFTYIGQLFNYAPQPIITATAQNFAGGTTVNYTGSLMKIANSTLTPGTQASRYSAAGGTLDVTSLPAIGGDPAITDNADGTVTLKFSSGGGIAFQRTTPVAPFDAAIDLAVNVIDSDGIAYASNPVAFSSIAFSSGAAMRFGQLKMSNAHGSELLRLQIPMEAQYWNGTTFVTNSADSCTSIAAGNITMDGYKSTLAACETAISGGGTLVAGRGTLYLSRPGAGNSGSANLRMNLGTAVGNTCLASPGAESAATTASRSYLRSKSGATATYDDDPHARATFGIYKSGPVIYMREMY